MNPRTLPMAEGATAEVSALIETLHKTGRRLEDLTAGEVDAVTSRDGQTVMLRRAQDQLRHSDAVRQTAILNALPANIALLDTEGVIVSVNEGWREFAGANALLSPKFGIGLSYLEICDRAQGDDASRAQKAAAGIRSVLTGTATTFSLEYPCHSPTQRRWFLLTATPLADERPNGAVVMHLDITERIRSHEALRRFRAAMDTAADAIVLVNRSTMRFVDVNAAACAMLGYTREELFRLGPSQLGAATPEQLAEVYDTVIACRCTSELTETRLRRKDGSHLQVEVRRHAHRAGADWIIVGVVRDITERKQAETKIVRLNRVYAILSAINSAIVRIRGRDELFREVCRIAVSEGGFTLARVLALDAHETVRIAASSESDPAQFQGIVDEYNGNPEQSRSLLKIALRSREPVIANNVATDPRIPNRAALTKGGNYAVALLPLIVEQRIAGALMLRTREAGMFDEAELRVLVELTSNLAFGLEHMEKEAKVRRLTRVYAVLSGINTLIVRTRDRDELFREACRIAVEQGQFRMAWIGIVDRHAMRLVPVASAGTTQDSFALVKQGFSLLEDAPLGNILSARAIREKKIFVSNEVQTDSRIVFKEDHAKRGSRSLAVLPLLGADEAIGVLALYAGEAGFFDAEEVKLLTELTSNIAYAIDHIEKHNRLDYLAFYDPLTGLANRSRFLERVAQYMRSAADGGHKLAVFLIDLERFRNINESLGRPAGDALLKQVADWLTRTTGDAGLLARVGVDLFAVVMPKVREGGNVARYLEKWREAFLAHPFRLKDAVFHLAAKVGVAQFPDDGGDAETLFRNAEAALKKAKTSGHRYLFYTQTMTSAVADRLTMENQLRQALDKEEFVLHYQPKLSLASGKLTGAEALIRWNDPRTGLVPPGEFIPILEEIGLIHEVGRWAMRQAMADYLRWCAAGLPAVRIAVNVSALQLRSPGFIAEIGQAIGIDARAAAGLELEVTESVIMEDTAHTISSLAAIRAMGLTIAIDDFGTGFSSLSYLAKLPVDALKIDRSFVNDMTASSQGLALVSTIIGLAHALKLKVVAEGVETEEQSRLLRLLGCDEMQGFLFSKPVPVDIFEAKFLALSPPEG